MLTTPVVAIIAPGGMGAATAARLTHHGVRVLTDLEGRSAASVARAKAAGMEPADLAAIAGDGAVAGAIATALRMRACGTTNSDRKRPVEVSQIRTVFSSAERTWLVSGLNTALLTMVR